MQNTPQGGAPTSGAPQPGINPGGQPYQPRRPAWWYWVGGGIVAVVLCCGCAGIASLVSHSGATTTDNSGNVVAANQSGGGTTTKATPTATHTPQWTTVQKFTGTTSQKTPLFNVPNEWRIVWTCKKADQFGGNFSVEIMDPDGTPVDLAVNTTDNDGSTTYEHQGGGQVYLDIQTFSEKWTVEVQVQQ